jgi:hypothetical protein
MQHQQIELSQQAFPVDLDSEKSMRFLKRTYSIAGKTAVLDGERVQLGQTLSELLEHL